METEQKAPFKKGDWITHKKDSQMFAPTNQHVWQAEDTPVYVGKETGSGFRYRTVDCAHFRKATLHDAEQEVIRLRKIEDVVRRHRLTLLTTFTES
jgi:hypothetical protein